MREGNGAGRGDRVYPKQKHVSPDPTIDWFYPVHGAEVFMGSVDL